MYNRCSQFTRTNKTPSNLLEEAELGLGESHLVKSSLRKIPLKILQVSVLS